MDICTSNDSEIISVWKVGMGTNLYPLQLSIVNDLILGLRLDHHNVSHLCTRAGADTGLFDVAVSCAARELDTGGTYRTRLIAVKKPRPVPDVVAADAAADDNLLHLSRTQFLSCTVKLLFGSSAHSRDFNRPSSPLSVFDSFTKSPTSSENSNFLG